MAVDVSIIVNAHQEGLLAAPSIRSADRARVVAENQGIVLETIYVLDRSDQNSIDQFRFNGNENAKFLEVQYGDPGLARNAGVEAASGRWIAFLDADDLWGHSWIRDAFKYAEARSGTVVWHPEINLIFGETNRCFVHPDMEDGRFEVSWLAVINCWTALCFASRRLLLEVPYRPTVEDAYYEDWSWNTEVIFHGGLHKVVPGAVHAIRIKPYGQNKLAQAANALPHPSWLYRDILLRRGAAGSRTQSHDPA